MADYKDVVEMLGENLASFLELSKKLLVDWAIEPKKLLHLLQNIRKDDWLGLLEGTHEIKLKEVSEPVLDFTVQVDRNVRPIYPGWVKEVKYPDLELSGTHSYYLDSLGLWLHEKQKIEDVTGNIIYEELEKTNALGDCLNLQDLLAIQEKGIKVFRALFKGKAVFAWKSVVLIQNGYLSVPYLIEREGEVVLGWFWLDNYWSSNDPALRFAK